VEVNDARASRAATAACWGRGARGRPRARGAAARLAAVTAPAPAGAARQRQQHATQSPHSHTPRGHRGRSPTARRRRRGVLGARANAVGGRTPGGGWAPCAWCVAQRGAACVAAAACCDQLAVLATRCTCTRARCECPITVWRCASAPLPRARRTRHTRLMLRFVLRDTLPEDGVVAATTGWRRRG
jgi:hypothetical protein